MSWIGSVFNFLAPALKCLAPLLIVLVIAAALLGVAAIQRKRLTKKFRLQIRNTGNITSRYQLRAQDTNGSLEFKFFLDGSLLPNLVKEAPVAASSGYAVPVNNPVLQPAPGATTSVMNQGAGAMQTAATTGGAVASLLTAIGSFLPRSIGQPFMKAGSKLYQGQMKVGYAQQVGQRAAYLAPAKKGTSLPPSTPAPAQAASSPAVSGPTWAETPAIPPGETLLVDIHARSSWVSSDQEIPFRIISQSVEGDKSPEVIEDGRMRVSGGFLSHRIWPRAVILLLGLALLAAALWFSFGGTLS